MQIPISNLIVLIGIVFLTLPRPVPEKTINSDPEMFWKNRCSNKAMDKSPFSARALEEYLQASAGPDAVHASCQDYRAAASIDIQHDDAAMGRKLAMPILVLWAKHGVIEKCFDALEAISLAVKPDVKPKSLVEILEQLPDAELKQLQHYAGMIIKTPSPTN